MSLNERSGLPAGKVAAYSPVEKSWLKATAKVMKGNYHKTDSVDPNFLNHVTWYVMTGWKHPYSGEDQFLSPGPLVRAAMK
jgi:hypothetical protein